MDRISSQILQPPNTQKPNPKILNITHYDLDGVGCAVCLHKVYKNITSIPTGYNNLLSTIIDIEQSLYNVDIIYVTDLQLSLEHINLLSEYLQKYPNLQVIIFDHHQNISDIIPPNIIYKHSQKLSGTGITFSYFYKTLSEILLPNELQEYNNFFKSINSFDCWVEDDFFIKGLEYNNLFWEYKFHKFLLTYIDMMTHNKQSVIRDLNRIQENKIKYFNFLKSNNQLLQNQMWCISFADSYVNELQIIYPDHMYYINITGKSNISLRVNKKYKNIIPIFKEYISQYNPIRGGGHEFICSIQMSQPPSELIDIVKKFVTEVKYD